MRLHLDAGIPVSLLPQGAPTRRTCVLLRSGRQELIVSEFAAEAFLRRLDLALRTPDALKIAIVQRTGAKLATFDGGVATAARGVGG